VKHSSIRTFFSVVAMYDLELEQLDVKTAFFMESLRRTYIWTSRKGS